MRRVPVLAVLLTAVIATSACSGSSDSPTIAASSTPAPESVTTSAAAVKTGLTSIQELASQIAAAGSDKAKAASLDEGIEPLWSKIEGTVKANSADSYLAFEDAFAVLEAAAKDGDAAKASSGSAAVTKAVSEYLAKYPG